MANSLNVVPVRTNDESCIVVRMVDGTKTRCAVVLSARHKRRAIEGLDLLAIARAECEVKMRRCFFGFEANAQGRLTVWAAKFDAERPLGDNGYAERFERLDEERFTRRIVADSEYDVVKHGFPEVCGLHEA